MPRKRVEYPVLVHCMAAIVINGEGRAAEWCGCVCGRVLAEHRAGQASVHVAEHANNAHSSSLPHPSLHKTAEEKDVGRDTNEEAGGGVAMLGGQALGVEEEINT